jgi:hypothetical protein
MPVKPANPLAVAEKRFAAKPDRPLALAANLLLSLYYDDQPAGESEPSWKSADVRLYATDVSRLRLVG